LVLYLLLPGLLWWAYKRTVKKAPSGSDLPNVIKIVGIALKKNGLKIGRQGFWDAAKPSFLAEQGITSFKSKPIDWSDSFVEDVGRTVKACQIFLFFPFFNINDGGIGNIQTSQGASMITNGAPNDLLSNFNPLTIIVAIPILNYGLYPFLRKHNLHFGRISRITLGFLLAAISSVIGAILQWRVYVTSPCGYYATACTIAPDVAPISIWTQIPLYVLGALGECFANVTAYEIAYARSPPNMKALVMAFFLFTTALSSALSEALTPLLVDPYLIWPFVATAAAGFVTAAWFWFAYRELDHDEFMTENNKESMDDNIIGHDKLVDEERNVHEPTPVEIDAKPPAVEPVEKEAAPLEENKTERDEEGGKEIPL